MYREQFELLTYFKYWNCCSCQYYGKPHGLSNSVLGNGMQTHQDRHYCNVESPSIDFEDTNRFQSPGLERPGSGFQISYSQPCTGLSKQKLPGQNCPGPMVETSRKTVVSICLGVGGIHSEVDSTLILSALELHLDAVAFTLKMGYINVSIQYANL